MKRTITDAYEVEVDQDLVVDGRAHAEHLISQAYRLLMPYVNECLACSDQLFQNIANQAIEKIHSGQPDSLVMFLGDERDFHGAVDAHMERQHASTARLLGQMETHH